MAIGAMGADSVAGPEKRGAVWAHTPASAREQPAARISAKSYAGIGLVRRIALSMASTCSGKVADHLGAHPRPNALRVELHALDGQRAMGRPMMTDLFGGPSPAFPECWP